MPVIKIYIDKETRRDIKSIYRKNDHATVKAVVENIIERYLGVEYLDPELTTDDDGIYKICKFCGERSKINKMIDVDGRNFEEAKFAKIAVQDILL